MDLTGSLDFGLPPIPRSLRCSAHLPFWGRSTWWAHRSEGCALPVTWLDHRSLKKWSPDRAPYLEVLGISYVLLFGGGGWMVGGPVSSFDSIDSTPFLLRSFFAADALHTHIVHEIDSSFRLGGCHGSVDEVGCPRPNRW